MLKKESHFTHDLVGKGVLSVLVGVRPNAILADFFRINTYTLCIVHEAIMSYVSARLVKVMFTKINIFIFQSFVSLGE